MITFTHACLENVKRKIDTKKGVNFIWMDIVSILVFSICIECNAERTHARTHFQIEMEWKMNILTNKYTTNNNNVIQFCALALTHSHTPSSLNAHVSAFAGLFGFWKIQKQFSFVHGESEKNEFFFFGRKLKSRFSTWLNWWVVGTTLNVICRIRTITISTLETCVRCEEDAINANELTNWRRKKRPSDFEFSHFHRKSGWWGEIFSRTKQN